MTRYTFEEVRYALDDAWGLSLHRGGFMVGGEHDGLEKPIARRRAAWVRS
jgi:hypothetical protein